MNKSVILKSIGALSVAFSLVLVPLAAQATPVQEAAAPVSPQENPFEDVSRSAEVPIGMSILGTTIKYPEGGEWRYGFTGVVVKTLYSDYYHPTKKHGSSVVNGNGTTNRSDIVQPKSWSRSKVHHTFSGNQAYYRFE